MRLLDLALCLPPLAVGLRSLPWVGPVRLPAGAGPAAATASAAGVRSPSAAGPTATGRLDLVVDDGRTRRPVTVFDTTWLGSAPTCGICVGAEGVDPRHATFARHRGRWTVVDGGSSTGIWWNEAPVFERTSLRTGDQLRIGSVLVEVVAAG